MNKNAEYYGDANYTITEPIMLQAGPVRMIYQDGILRSISIGEYEIVQRIYMSLRDKFWNTIHPQVTPVLTQINESSFHIRFKAIHRKKEISFLWCGEIKGEDDGTIYYSMHGEALTTFERNRIGFCILHPLELCVGRACTIESIDGNFHEETFPVFISPFQPFKDIRQISYKVPSADSVSIRFEGDTFEMEDQRNWTDASFKTYSTPLSLPIPETVFQGSIIEQSVTIKIQNARQIPISIPKPIELRIANQSRFQHQLPLIGVCNNNSEQLSPFAIEMIERLSLSHLRIDLQCDSNSIIGEMENAVDTCSHLGTSAELALHFTPNFESEIQLLVKVLNASQIPVSSFLIYRKDLPVTPAETISSLLPSLYAYAPSAFIGSGTDSYFVEINREHPNTESLDYLCYSANPQVHTFDNEAVMKNLQGLAETLRTAALFQGKARPAITPLTLRPRFNATKPEKFGGADPRQKGLFGAAWTLGSFMHCIEGGAQSITCFETVGTAGLMPAQEKAVYPLYHILASVREMRGALVQSCNCSDPDRIASIALFGGASMMLLVANLTDTVQQVTIFDLPESISFVSLDENTFEEATLFPQQWRCKKGVQRIANGPFHIFDILPYATLRIEASII